MKHEYSTQQIKTALAATTEAMGAFQIGAEVDGTTHHDPDYWPDDEIQAVRTILKHLPAPTGGTTFPSVLDGRVRGLLNVATPDQLSVLTDIALTAEVTPDHLRQLAHTGINPTAARGTKPAPATDDLSQGLSDQVLRLRYLTADTNEATKWLTAINHLISTGTKRESLLGADESDDWQECTIDQIRKGDRVRWQDPGMEDTCTYEIIADHTEAEDPGWILFSRTESYYFPPGAVVDRIPAPVQHPDPEVHKYILVHKADPKYNRHIFPNVGMSNGSSGYGVSHIHIPAEYILEWEELTPKVIEDDR